MTNESTDPTAVSHKRGGGSREYMQDFARGRTNLHCESCGFNMRRDPDFGSEADGDLTDRYCSICYRDGAFVHQVSSTDEFIAAAAPAIAERSKQSAGKVKLTLKKDLPKLARWKKS